MRIICEGCGWVGSVTSANRLPVGMYPGDAVFYPGGRDASGGRIVLNLQCPVCKSGQLSGTENCARCGERRIPAWEWEDCEGAWPPRLVTHCRRCRDEIVLIESLKYLQGNLLLDRGIWGEWAPETPSYWENRVSLMLAIAAMREQEKTAKDRERWLAEAESAADAWVRSVKYWRWTSGE
jgi:hypothetical protein